MPEETPQTSPSASNESTPIAPQPPIPFNIGEEFGTARKNLPPTKILVICVAAIAVIVGIVAFTQRPRQTAAGAIENIAAADIPNQNQVMIAVAISVQNQGKEPYVIREISADLETNGSTYKDSAAPAVDFERYFTALPALRERALSPLRLESKIAPGDAIKGTMIVTFPVSQDAFNHRKSLKVTIRPAKQPLPLVLTQ